MHLPSIVGLVTALGTLATVNGATYQDSCNTPAIITVIKTTTVTESAVAPSYASYISAIDKGLVSTATAAAQFTSDGEELTATVTLFSTITRVVTLVPQSASSSVSDQGTYYFTVTNGTTTWLFGNTPPAAFFSTSYTVETSTLLVVPVPFTSTASLTTSTSVSTVYETSFITRVFSTTITESVGPSTTKAFVSAAVVTTLSKIETAEPYTSLAISMFSGWNFTATPAIRSAVTTVAPFLGWNSTAVSIPQPGGSESFQPSRLASIAVTSRAAIVTNFPTTTHCSEEQYSSREISKRQLGAWVSATIDGEAVSWVNIWEGAPLPAAYSGESTEKDAFPTSLVISAASYNYFQTQATSEPSSVLTNLYYFPNISASTIVPPPSSLLSLNSPSAGSASTTVIAYYGVPPPVITGLQLSATLTTISPNSTVSLTAAAASATALETTASENAAPSASPTGCETRNPLNMGNFTINFDDLPTFGAPAHSNNYPPIFNPYHNLFWSQGYAYAPPPADPYPPHSPPQLAIFITNGSANVHSQNFTGTPPAGEEVNGQFGAGYRYASRAFWIDVYSMFVGCNNAGPADCQLTALGYQYNNETETTELTVEQTFYQEPCPTLKNCSLIQIFFEPDFYNLTSLQIVATVEHKTEPITWFMDDVAMGWTDNSCEAGKIRDAAR